MRMVDLEDEDTIITDGPERAESMKGLRTRNRSENTPKRTSGRTGSRRTRC